MAENRNFSASDPAAWLGGGGEMGKLVAGMDWSRTPLGAISAWPDSLLTTVNLALASNFPISLAWGPGRVQIYNDGYWPICGAKHPQSMGQDFKECWYSAWPVIGDAFETATSGQSAFLVNQRMFLDRNNYLEETFFTFSFSPIRDQTGQVVGLFHPVTELTLQSLAERRLALIQDIADRSGNMRSVEEAIHAIVDVLRENLLDVTFAGLYQLNADGDAAHLVASSNVGDGVLPERFSVADARTDGWPLGTAVREGEAPIVEDGWLAEAGLGSGPYPEASQQAMVLPVGFPAMGHPLGVLVAGVSPRRILDETYRRFYAMLADAVGNSLTNAHSYQVEKQRSEALQELDKAKTTFFSNISHEFRTPLTLMLGPIEDLLGDSGLGGEVRDSLLVAQRNALRLLKLVNALLDFSRIEAGRMQVAYEATDLSELTSDLASHFRSACERAGVELSVDCGSGVRAYVDREMWEKVVLNLISNAFKFTLEGRIEIRLRQVGSEAVLTVSDTGVGVPEEEMPRLFERFHRVASTQGRTYEGSGIGLSLVKELTRLHGGDVTAESELGKGTTFTVRIPRGHRQLASDNASRSGETSTRAEAYVSEAMRWLGVEDQADAARAPQPDGAAATGHILVIDDNADMRGFVRRSLSGLFEVSTAEHGRAGLDKALANPPDLVISDVMMPHMDGFELLKALRADPRTRAIPIILLSARAGGESRVEGIEAGADDYLVKPFDVRELIARVQTQLRLAEVRGETERALRDADRRKDSFLATLGHELRNPLAAISNALQLVQATNDPGELRRFSDLLERQVSMLTHMVDDLLDVPRITHGKLRLNTDIVDVREALQSSLEEIQGAAAEKAVSINAHGLDEPGFVDGDPVRMAQVFTNLLSNAVKYTPPGGRVDISRIDDDERVGVSIKDTGIGIEPSDHPRVFEMYAQLGSDYKPTDGLGIGLAVVRKLMQLHGGTVEVSSEGRDCGSEFRVWFPKAAQPGQAVAAGQAVNDVEPGRLKILLADDNVDACDSMQALLEVSGHEVVTAYDGTVAIEKARDFRPDVAIIDLVMPGLDGFEVARRLREADWSGGMRLIALSGLTQDADLQASAEAGFDLHLTKPLQLDDLKQALHTGH